MNGEHFVDVRVGQFREGPVAQDSGVVDHSVDPAVLTHRGGDYRRSPGRCGDGVHRRDGPAAGREDLADNIAGGGGRPAAVDVAADVVDHHSRAAGGKRERVRPAEAAARARDDDNPAAQFQFGHGASLPTTATKATHEPGWPPRFCATASLASGTCRSPASPRSWVKHSNSIRSPVAPTG